VKKTIFAVILIIIISIFTIIGCTKTQKPVADTSKILLISLKMNNHHRLLMMMVRGML